MPDSRAEVQSLYFWGPGDERYAKFNVQGKTSYFEAGVTFLSPLKSYHRIMPVGMCAPADIKSE